MSYPYPAPDADTRYPYVLLPVPEEHVDEVVNYMLQVVARGALNRWDPPSIEAFLDEADEQSRALLAMVAHTTIGVHELTVAGAAAQLGVSERELVGLIRELADRSRSLGRDAIVLIRTMSDASDDDDTATDREILWVPMVVQRYFRSQTSAEPAGASIQD